MGVNGFSAVLCDMDGTILDSMHHHARAWQTIFADWGLRLPLEPIYDYEGCLGEEVLQQLIAKHGAGRKLTLMKEQSRLNAALSAMLEQQARLYLQQHADQVKPYPYARRFVNCIKSTGAPVALVTSSRRSVVQGVLGPGLTEAFDVVVTADDVTRHKPDPQPYLAGAKALGVDPAGCLVVENAPAGVRSALAAGATCYALTTTLPAAKLEGAHEVFTGLEELAAHLGMGPE